MCQHDQGSWSSPLLLQVFSCVQDVPAAETLFGSRTGSEAESCNHFLQLALKKADFLA